MFVDLDRTLLRGASGLVLSAAMHAEGLFDGRRSLPGERLFYGFYDLMGESLAFMAMVRAAPRFTRGWPVESVCRAGELAAPELVELVQPYAPGVLAEHREAGHLIVLTTTTPVDLITPFAGMLGFDHVLATRYGRADGRYTGGIEGEFVWSTGKLAAVRRWAGESNVDLSASHAYSDSVFDLPLLSAVGRPHAVNPDRRLNAVARLRRWPVERWDRPAGGAQGGRPRALRHAAARGAPRAVPLCRASTSTAWPASRGAARSSSPPTIAATSTWWPWPSWRPGSVGPCGSWPSGSCSTRPSWASWRGPWAGSPWTGAAAPTRRCARPAGPSRRARSS